MTTASTLDLLQADRSRRFREQRGTVVKRSDGFYIRYYKDVDGGERIKVTERLCDLITSATSLKLQQKCFMSGVNTIHHTALQSPTEAPGVTIGGFWAATYLPWLKENKRTSTVRGYTYDWKLYVRPELENRKFDGYTTVHACELLDHMVTVKKLNENTLAHVKSLCRGIFATAVRKGIINVNPWREAKESVRVRPEKTRIAYTPEETIAI